MRRLSCVPMIYPAPRQDTRLRKHLLLAGVKAMLIKPFDPRMLMAADPVPRFRDILLETVYKNELETVV